MALSITGPKALKEIHRYNERVLCNLDEVKKDLLKLRNILNQGTAGLNQGNLNLSIAYIDHALLNLDDLF